MTFTFKGDLSKIYPHVMIMYRSAAARQFRNAAWDLANQIRDNRRVGESDIQKLKTVQTYLDQMIQCASATGSLQLLTHPDDIWLMAKYAFELYLALYTWIEHCHPSQLDPKTRDHASFAGTVIDHLQSKHLNILENWPKALFIREDSHRWHYNPELFTALRKACETPTAKPKTIGEVAVEEYWSRFNKEKNKAKIGAPAADDHSANSYTQAQVAIMFGPPCNAEKVANWEAKARGSSRGSVPPSAKYKGRFEGYRAELRKFPTEENTAILTAIIKQYKATEGVKGKLKAIHPRSAESLYQAQKKHGA